MRKGIMFFTAGTLAFVAVAFVLFHWWGWVGAWAWLMFGWLIFMVLGFVIEE